MKYDEAKVKSDFEKSKSRAQEYINDPEKTKKLLDAAAKKADDIKGPLDKIWEDIQLMFGIVRDWLSGDYKEVPVGSIIAIIGGIIYFVAPIDVVPDFIPGAGYLDDVFVLGLVINQVKSDLQKYKVWKYSKID